MREALRILGVGATEVSGRSWDGYRVRIRRCVRADASMCTGIVHDCRLTKYLQRLRDGRSAPHHTGDNADAMMAGARLLDGSKWPVCCFFRL